MSDGEIPVYCQDLQESVLITDLYDYHQLIIRAVLTYDSTLIPC